jgi:hypothetical protein
MASQTNERLDEIETAGVGSHQDQTTRQVSRFVFPYYDLDASLKVAEALHEKAGGKASLIQLASYLGHKDEFSGAFRAKLWGAQLFGIIDIKRRDISLTPLGEQLASPRAGIQRDRRLAEAFLNVPLFKEVYRRYESSAMPSTREGLKMALEVSFGVSPRRLSAALKTLLGSAEQAGFMRQDPNRLIHPVPAGLVEHGTVHEPDQQPEMEPAPQTPSGFGFGTMERTEVVSNVHPAIQGFLSELPVEGRTWSAGERQRWMDAFIAIIVALYPSESEITE